MHIVFGLTRLFAGLLIGYYLFNPDKRNDNKILNNYPTAFKILSAVLVLSGFYSVFLGKGTYDLNNSVWSNEDKEIMINNCLRDSGGMKDKYPEEMTKYCNCSTEGIINNVQLDEYLRIMKMEMKDQNELLLKYYEPCLVTLRNETKTNNVQ
jgi:hypothetical protein